MLYTSLFVWEMSVRYFGLMMRVMDLMIGGVWIYDVNFDGFGERVIFGWLDCWKCLIFVGEMGLEWYFVLSNLYWFFEDFDQVRLKPYFIRAERYFEGIFDDFWRCWNGEKHWFFKVLPNSVSNSKWGSRRENIRYAAPGNRTLVLKCKHTPPCAGYMTNKRS